MGLLDLFSKLVVEHGSAEVQSKHIALFKDRLALADKNTTLLESENAILKTENEKLKSDIQESQKENKLLRSKIHEYEQTSHDYPITDESIKILSYLAKNEEPSTLAIARTLNIEIETARFFLHELRSLNMVIDNFRIDEYGSGFHAWSLEQEGRRFLMKNKMLT